MLAFSCFVFTLLFTPTKRMATLFKNDNSPYWKARFFDAEGNRVSQSTGSTSKREAKRIAENLEFQSREKRGASFEMQKALSAIIETAAREATAGELTLARAEHHLTRLHRLANPDYKEISLRDYWQKWITDQSAHVVESTLDNYQDDLKRMAEGLGEKVMQAPVRSLTADQVKAGIEKLRKKGNRKGATINLALSSLRRVMESAVAGKVATHNPAKHCRLLSDSDSTTRAPFTIAEIRAMLDHSQTSDEWKGAVTIAAHTGLRMGDVLSLTESHVDGTRISIMPAKTAKSKKVITVPLTPACIAWIGNRKGEFFPTLKKQSKPTTAMQFGAIMKKAGIARDIEIAGGIQARRSFHSLRHTFASMLAEADVHADIRQKLTGHETSKIHQRYTHHDESLDRAVAMLPML
jgi:integrase